MTGHSFSVNTKWSGLETSGMRDAKCSLLLQDEIPYDAKIKALPKQRVLVHQDRGFHPASHLHPHVRHHLAATLMPHQHPSSEENFYVDFKGATIFQLEPTPHQAHAAMPVTITVGGRCLFTPENYQDFKVMMRTKEQSVEMDISPNGSFDWPDVSSLLLCPVCGERGPIPRETNSTPLDDDDDDHHQQQQRDSFSLNYHEYWMIFYPLLQISVMKGAQLTLGTRTICRFVCLDCMEELLDGVTLTVQPGGGTSRSITTTSPSAMGRRSTRLAFTLPARDVLAEAGTASFLEDGPPRPDTHPHLDDLLDAWTLYNLWEHSGAWEALQNDYRVMLSRSMQGDPSATHSRPTSAAATLNLQNVDGEEDSEPCRLKERMGKPCGNLGCNKVHGRTDATDGQVVRLSIKCQHCQSEYYCSKACREAAESVHRDDCERKQKDREERREKKAKKVECDTCHQKFPHTKMKKCSRCRHAQYCSPECQKLAWDAGHKNVCQQIPR